MEMEKASQAVKRFRLLKGWEFKSKRATKLPC